MAIEFSTHLCRHPRDSKSPFYNTNGPAFAHYMVVHCTHYVFSRRCTGCHPAHGMGPDIDSMNFLTKRAELEFEKQERPPIEVLPKKFYMTEFEPLTCFYAFVSSGFGEGISTEL